MAKAKLKEEEIKNEEKKGEKLDVSIRYTINYYLKESKHPEEIQRMMRDLFKGRSKTLEEWKYADEKINKRRC